MVHIEASVFLLKYRQHPSGPGGATADSVSSQWLYATTLEYKELWKIEEVCSIQMRRPSVTRDDTGYSLSSEAASVIDTTTIKDSCRMIFNCSAVQSRCLG